MPSRRHELPALPGPIVAAVVGIVAVGLVASAEATTVVSERAGLSGLLVWAPFICADLAQAVTMFVAMTGRAIHGGVRAFAALLTATFLTAVCVINAAAHGPLGLVAPLSGGLLLVLLHVYRHSLRADAERAERERAAADDHRRRQLDRERAEERAHAREMAEIEARARAERPRSHGPSPIPGTPAARAIAASAAAPTDTDRIRAHIEAEVAAGRPVPTGADMVTALGVKGELARRVRSDWRRANPERDPSPVHAVAESTA